MKILLAEDNQRLGKMLHHLLQKQDHQVEWVEDGESAYEEALFGAYELVILDWMMPKLSGIDVCEKLRKNGYGGSILMLTAKDQIEDRIEGLDAGADDYLIKPFEFDELAARIRALGRRSSKKLQAEELTIGLIRLNRTEKSIWSVSGEKIQLSLREFQLFDILVQNCGIVVSREILLDRIWGMDSDVTSNNLDSYIRILRRKLELEKNRIEIHTIRGIGYKLEETVDV